VTAVPVPGPDDGQSLAAVQNQRCLSPILILIWRWGESICELDGEESKDVLKALCRHEPSSVDRQAFSRPHRWQK
jgi:hypothetical protein